ncbi:MAG: stage II sporulation protein M [Candidatus Hydrothermarchaeaceae archaeon]
MMERSIKIYLFGFIVGLVVCFILLLSYPSLYYAFLAILMKKTEMQTDALGGSQTLSIGLNNVVASLLAAYGGYILSKIFFLLNNNSHYAMPGLLGMLDAKSRAVPRERLKYYLALYTFPTFALFINGFVLGAFLMLYAENLEAYLANLLPHGFLEVPGILLSGGIGLTIADGSVFGDGDLKENLEEIARRQVPRYLIVMELLIISAFLEVLPAA